MRLILVGVTFAAGLCLGIAFSDLHDSPALTADQVFQQLDSAETPDAARREAFRIASIPSASSALIDLLGSFEEVSENEKVIDAVLHTVPILEEQHTLIPMLTIATYQNPEATQRLQALHLLDETLERKYLNGCLATMARTLQRETNRDVMLAKVDFLTKYTFADPVESSTILVDSIPKRNAG